MGLSPDLLSSACFLLAVLALVLAGAFFFGSERLTAALEAALASTTLDLRAVAGLAAAFTVDLAAGFLAAVVLAAGFWRQALLRPWILPQAFSRQEFCWQWRGLLRFWRLAS